jgi:glucose/arabinose dehydrogenase
VDSSLYQPIDFSFDPVYDNQDNMHVDIYFIERGERQGGGPGDDITAKLKRFDAINNQVSILGEWDVMVWDPTKENGMTGIALDPDFKENRWVYLHYSIPEGPTGNWDENFFIIARYTLNQDYSVDFGSEKVLLRIPINATACCHSGGPLNFDHYGDLWIGTGDQPNYFCNNDPDPYGGCFQHMEDKTKTAEITSSDTKSMLGAYLRIHPDDTAPNGYTIPEGNFGEYWGDYFEDQGEADLAAEYRNPDLVLPELYAKGTRNPYAMRLDPVRRWVVDGNCGPDGPGTWDIDADRHTGPTEEFNLLTHPTFMGWPYFAGPNIWIDDKHDPAYPINDSPWRGGVERLPPAEEAIYSYPRQCAMTGPIYRYDPDLDSDMKLPPHFNRAWFVTDFNQSWMKTFYLNDEGTEITNVDETAFPGKQFYKPLTMDIGPDGALYINNYAGYNDVNQNTNISRIEYTGDCLPDRAQWTGTFEKVGCTNEDYDGYDEYATHMNQEMCGLLKIGRMHSFLRGVEFDGPRISITVPGDHTVSLLRIDGRPVAEQTGSEAQAYDVSKMKKEPGTGIYLVKVTTSEGTLARKIPLM